MRRRCVVGRRLGNSAGLASPPFFHRRHDLGIAKTHDAARQKRCIDGSGATNGQRAYRDAGGHLDNGKKAVLALQGGAAHLPGMTASMTPLPVLGVPVESAALKGQDSLLSIVQMPAGIPVGTLAIGRAGAVNAALLAGSIVGLGDAKIMAAVEKWRARQTGAVARAPSDDAATPHR